MHICTAVTPHAQFLITTKKEVLFKIKFQFYFVKNKILELKKKKG